MRDGADRRRAERFGAPAASLALGAALLLGVGCGSSPPEGPLPGNPPNILFVVWDTVRADRLALYGHSKPTTPHLDAWAKGARVFDDCVAAAPYTVPSHASMFTGLLPTEHGASNRRPVLDDSRPTLAEILRARGYQTYLFSANPHISREEKFDRGFDVEEHPWDPRYRSLALDIVAEKIVPEDVSSELAAKIRARAPKGGWDIKAAGELARRGAEAWLERRDPRRPFFVFINYMEAHRPWIPPAAYRRRMMAPDRVARSYQIDRSWVPHWSYTFGLHDYTDDELEVMAATYDACLAELDQLFHELLESLRSKGLLENTVVVLTADHGEHLGERHLLDHQYSLYEPVLRVPLVIHDAKRFPPGRDPRPVMNHDLFPTLLGIAGVEAPARRSAVSLLEPRDDRPRVAEYLGPFQDAYAAVEAAHPGFSRSPWEREIRAIYRGGGKLIRWSDGKEEMYAPREDPTERTNLAPGKPAEALELGRELARFLSTLERREGAAGEPPPISGEHRERLRALGYVHDGAEVTAPASKSPLPGTGKPRP